MDKKLNILLITGIVTSEHDPKVNPMLRRILESTGRFKVKITEEFRGATAETLAPYDAVLLNYDGKESVETPYVGLGMQAEKALYDFVASGKGVIVYHSSMIKGDLALPEAFVRLTGVDFNFQNGGRKSPKLEMIIDVDDQAHPITHGLNRSWMTAQDDFFCNVAFAPGTDVTVLATVNDDLADYDISKMQAHRRDEFQKARLEEIPGINTAQPVAWVNRYGSGRVFVVSIGHGPDTLRRPQFIALLCRAAEWVASDRVTIEPPNLDNLNRLRAWPFYDGLTLGELARLTEGL
jgi:uncharacterized protein